MPKKKLKQFPVLQTDDEVEDFVANCDLTEYDLSGFKPVHYEFAEKQNKLEKEPPAEPE